MAAAKVSIAMQNQIFELRSKGVTVRQIAKTLKVGRNTIKRVLERGEIVSPGADQPEWSRAIDWEKVRREVSQGVQMNVLAREHAGELISYVQFWRQFYKIYPEVPQTTMRLEHRPAERAFFDYTEGIDVVDAMTGEAKKTHLCCGVLASPRC